MVTVVWLRSLVSEGERDKRACNVRRKRQKMLNYEHCRALLLFSCTPKGNRLRNGKQPRELTAASHCLFETSRPSDQLRESMSQEVSGRFRLVLKSK